MKKLSAWARARTLRRKTQDNASEREESKDDTDLARANGQPISSSPLRPVPNIQQHFLSRSSNDGSLSNRPGSNNRIKPVLIGVSRPSDAFSRPNTAGSLQSAVDWAADRVAQSSPVSQKSHARTHSARHVDIFSVSRPGTAFPVYSEDVAIRNPEVTKNQYAPSSMYQEEVAARNAAPPLRSTLDKTKHVPDFTGPRTGAAPEIPEQGSYGNDEDTQKLDEAERATYYEDRGAKEFAGAPTSLPTGGEKSTTRLKTSASEHVMEILQNGRVPSTQPNLKPQQPTNLPDRPIEENDDYRDGDTQSPRFLPPNEAATIPAAKLSANQKVPSELSQHHEGDELPVGQSSASKRPLIASLSNTSSVKQAIIMPNSTVIDSTGHDSDVLSDGYPESFKSASPGVGDVHQETCSKPQLSMADSPGVPEHSSDYTHQSGTSNVTPRQPTSVEPEQGSSHTTIQHPLQSSFSPINVLVSLLPISQQEIQPVPEPHMVIAPLGKESRKPALNKLYTVAETEPEVEDAPTRVGVTAPLVDKLIIPPSSPASATDSTQPGSSQSTPTQVKLPSESQWSTDWTDPSSPYGIRTRDFALNPRRETNVAPENALSKRDDRAPLGTNARILSPPKARKVGSLPNGEGRLPVTPVKSKITRRSEEFNEEAFQRKQEQARAALIKLQHSLNEDFDDATPQATWAQPQMNGVNRYSNSSSSTDGRPHAPPPTYSLGQVLGHHRTAAPQFNGAYHPRETSLPRTSLSMSEPPTSPRSISSISSTARPLHRHSPMQSLQESRPRIPIRKRGETNPTLSEMRRLVYEMTHPHGHDRMYEPSLPSFPRSPEEVSLSSFPLPASSLSPTPDQTEGPSRQRQEQQQEQPSYTHQQEQCNNPYPFNFEPYDPEAAPSPIIRPYSTSPSRSRRRQKLMKKSGHMNTASSVSLHSIPAHLIPDRGSSMRDFSVKGDDDEEEVP